ncbi:MAG: DUF1343 domain-containing protein [Acidobacteriota bacterium]
MVRLGARSLAALLLVGLTACATPQGGSEPRLEDVDRQAVKLGAERLLETGIDRYAGQRVGLIAHSASILGGQRLVDLLAEREEIELVALFGPEHGFGGTAAAGEEVAEGRDAATGLPVFSLYGETKAPTPESLEGIDVLFFDLQDVGARYFTYISTMGLAMQAAARAGVRFVVLDRPNPLGGELVEGFVLDVEEHRSFVGYYPIPAVHGLTVGELARMIVGEAWLEDVEELELDVVAMSGWTRGMQWPDTGLPWVPPSPNLATFEAALHYPGTCLFEGTVFSEGRGTETPFELFGAPWLETSLFDGVELAGVRLEATTVTPVKSWRSGAPRFEGLEIPALRLVTMDRRAVRPLANGVEILTRLRDLAADLDEWVEDEWFDQLAGSGELRAALQAGASSTSLEHAWAASVQRHRLRRDPYLIYGSN